MIGRLFALAAAVAQGRSSKWPAVRAAHLRGQPACQVCGERGANDVHHILPFHLHPEFELAAANLITLCRPHHLLVGHLMSWRSWNEGCEVDAAFWRARIAGRPAGTVTEDES